MPTSLAMSSIVVSSNPAFANRRRATRATCSCVVDGGRPRAAPVTGELPLLRCGTRCDIPGRTSVGRLFQRRAAMTEPHPTADEAPVEEIVAEDVLIEDELLVEDI